MFIDKTGTLTKNQMYFKSVCINGVSFGKIYLKIKLFIFIGDKKDMTDDQLRILKGNKPIENVNFGDLNFKKIVEDI